VTITVLVSATSGGAQEYIDRLPQGGTPSDDYGRAFLVEFESLEDALISLCKLHGGWTDQLVVSAPNDSSPYWEFELYIDYRE
jgi:hypothetical protein